MSVFEQFVQLHKTNIDDQQRLGQRFVNMYITYPWTELFYERDDAKAEALIQAWLNDHQYWTELPAYARELPLGKRLA